LPAQAAYVSPAKIFARSTPGVIWVGAEQQSALDYLTRKESVRVVLGPASSGKSTLLQYYAQQAKGAVVLNVSGPQKSASGVLATLLTAAELGPWILSEVEQRNLLSVFLQQRQGQGKRIVVCIDNVARFSPDAWRELERLRLLKLSDKRGIELAIVAADLDAVRAPLAELVRADGALHPHFLPPPTDEDVAAYIDWRLAQFGAHNVFARDACALINSVTQGRFNFINILCQILLIEQRRTQAAFIDATLVDKSANALASMKEISRVALERMVETTPVEPRSGRLVVSCDDRVVCTFALQGRMLIGRSKDNDLHLPSRYLSRHHAAILPTEQGHYYIVDLNSANGVLVNGKSVASSLLLNGDVLELGQFRINVELSEPLPEPAASDVPAAHETDIMPAPAYETSAARASKG
jgi:type II secretory pathway predicted ATPase ExeA